MRTTVRIKTNKQKSGFRPWRTFTLFSSFKASQCKLALLGIARHCSPGSPLSTTGSATAVTYREDDHIGEGWERLTRECKGANDEKHLGKESHLRQLWPPTGPHSLHRKLQDLDKPCSVTSFHTISCTLLPIQRTEKCLLASLNPRKALPFIQVSSPPMTRRMEER